MIRVEIEATVQRRIEVVFDHLVDIPRYNEWMRRGFFVSTRKASDGPVGLGTRFSHTTRLGTVRGEISEFSRPRKVVFHYTARFLASR